HPAAAGVLQPVDTGAGDHFGAAHSQPCRQDSGDPRVVRDAFLRNAQSRNAADVRLDLPHFLPLQPAQAFQAIGATALFQSPETGYLGGVGSDDQFAADLVWNGILPAERHHLPDAADRQPRAHGAGLIVKPTVQHAAVMPSLVPPNLRFFFEDSDARARKTFPQPVSGGQPYDAAADDYDAPGIHGGEQPALPLISATSRRARNFRSPSRLRG